MYQPPLSSGQTTATCQRNISQHCWAQDVVCVWPRVPMSCNMLGVVGSSLKMWANNTQHVATCRSTMAKRTQHAAPKIVAICCVGMLPLFDRALWTFYWKHAPCCFTYSQGFFATIASAVYCDVAQSGIAEPAASLVRGSNGVLLVSRRYVVNSVWSNFLSLEPSVLVSIVFVRLFWYLYQVVRAIVEHD